MWLACDNTTVRIGAASLLVLLGAACDRGEPPGREVSGDVSEGVNNGETHAPESSPARSVTETPAPSQPTRDASIVIAPVLQQAARLCARGEFDAARALASHYAAEHPQDGLAEFVIGLTYHEAGNHGPAVTHFQRAVQLTPGHARTHVYFGECLFMLGDLVGARREYETLREAQPRNPEGAYRVGLVDLEEGRLDDAAARFREALALFDAMARTDPRQFAARRATVARCHARLADVHFARDEYEAARSELIASTTIEPRNISAFFTLSQVYRRLGQHDLADQAMERYESARRQILERAGGAG